MDILNVGEIRCDNASCDYVNREVSIPDMINWIDKPCPKCGENLLLEKDYDDFLLLLATMQSIPDVVEEDAEKERFTVHMHNGKLDIQKQ